MREEEVRDYESEARKDGWVPQEEWKGPEAKWSDAETFVQNGERIAGIAVNKAKKLEKAVETLQTRLDDVEATKREFVELKNREVEKVRKEKADLIAQLEQKQIDAINEGDGETFVRLKKEIEETQAEPAQNPAEAPWAKEWADENPWYAKDIVLRGVANEISQDMRRTGYADNGKNFMDEVSKRVKEALPEKFENPNRKRGITSGDGIETDETAPSTDKSFDSLPQDAKDACSRFVAEGLMTKDEYINSYEW